MNAEELSILRFDNKKKISFEAAFLPPLTNTYEENSSDSDSSDSSGDGERTRGRFRKRSHRSRPTVGGKSGSLASRLIHNQAIVIDDDEDSDVATSPRKRVKRSAGSKDVCVLDSPRSSLSPHSSSPSPQPSPPPPGSYLDGAIPTDMRSRTVLDKANNVLNQLRYSKESYSSPSIPDYTIDLNDSMSSSGAPPPFRLRVRCRGIIHKYNMYEMDPFSHVCTRLLADLKEDASQKVLLSHKTSTIKQTESPASLGLTTADILDAVVMAESSIADISTASLNDSQDSTGGGESITVTLRSLKKSTTYSLPISQPLQKAMTAFASELGVSITKLKFCFDGDPVDPSKTAKDMDMENDDCIDVTVTA